MFRRQFSLTVLFVLLASGGATFGETVRAADVMAPLAIDWMALARAQEAVRAGKSVDFIWQDHPAASYAQIRRSLWLAALHGITNQTCRDASTRRLMAPELERMHQRLATPFAYEVAVRDVASAEKLVPPLIAQQSSTVLIGQSEKGVFPTILRLKGHEVFGEQANLTFPSVQMAVSFSQPSHVEHGLVFEKNAKIAKNLFVRRFRDGSATVINLTDSPRPELTYQRGIRRTVFDLQPMGVIHLPQAEQTRFTRDCDEPFDSELWKVQTGPNARPRLIDAMFLQSVVAETYLGDVRYQTKAVIPNGDETLFLVLDTDNSETEVAINGRTLGIRAWEPFEWSIPRQAYGKIATLEIRVAKRTMSGFLQSKPVWHRR